MLGPVPWLVTAQRVTGAALDPAARLAGLRAAGQLPMLPPNVAGWPGGPAWFASATVVSRANLAAAVAALKEEPGDADIAVGGSISVIRQLITVGLLDELHLLVHPIAMRRGMQLFDPADAPVPLRLISSATLSTGVLNVVYGPEA